MLFVGIESRRSVRINLIWNGLILIFGIIALASEYQESLKKSCGSFMVPMVLINTVLMAPFMLANIWLIIKEKYAFDPRTRRKIRYLVYFIRLIAIIWSVVQFSLLFHRFYVENELKICQIQAHRSATYLMAMLILSAIETAMVAVYVLIVISIISLVMILHYCCGIQFTHDDEAQSGTQYLSRTTLVQARNLIGLGEEPETQCSICLVDYEDTDTLRKMPCDHYFHQDCIDTWINTHDTCPICQQKMEVAEPKFAEV